MFNFTGLLGLWFHSELPNNFYCRGEKRGSSDKMSHTNKAYASTESSSCNDSDGYSNSSSEYHQNVQNEMKANGVSQNGKRQFLLLNFS